jgi:predicted ABC-type sugar transport system permease subunit
VNRVIAALRGFGAFWWDFIVGDDWRIAAGVILGLAATAALATTSVPAWWLMPLAVAGLLGLSLWSATRAKS